VGPGELAVGLCADAGQPRPDTPVDGKRPVRQRHRRLAGLIGRRPLVVLPRPQVGGLGPGPPLLADPDVAEHVGQLVHPGEQRLGYLPGWHRPAPADRVGADLAGVPDLVVARAEPLVLGAEAARHDAGHRCRADEVEDPHHLAVGVGDQVLVPDRQAAIGEPLLGGDDRGRVVKPVPGERGHVVVRRDAEVGLEAVAGQAPGRGLDAGRDDVHRMPVQADEPGPGPDLQQQPGVLRRAQALVAVALLPPARQVGRHHRVEAAPQPLSHRRGDCAVGGVALVAGFRVRRRWRVLDHRPGACQLPGQPGQPRLGRAREVRMGVEQEPQQGGTRPAGAEHEDRVVTRPGRLVRWHRPPGHRRCAACAFAEHACHRPVCSPPV